MLTKNKTKTTWCPNKTKHTNMPQPNTNITHTNFTQRNINQNLGQQKKSDLRKKLSTHNTTKTPSSPPESTVHRPTAPHNIHQAVEQRQPLLQKFVVSSVDDKEGLAMVSRGREGCGALADGGECGSAAGLEKKREWRGTMVVLEGEKGDGPMTGVRGDRDWC